MRNMTLSLLPAAVLVVAWPAAAGTITISDVTGSFHDALPAGCCTIVNGPDISTVQWGTPGQSGYVFDAVIPPLAMVTVPPSPSPWVMLADFTHQNRPIQPPLLESVGLAVALAMDVDGTPVSATFEYMLTHTETPNSEPCPDWHIPGHPPCDDRVLVSAPALGIFWVEGVQYTLKLGFSKDGGATVLSQFVTEEGLDNTAGLYGQFTADVSTIIPEPGSFVLLGAGLTALVFALRRRKTC